MKDMLTAWDWKGPDTCHTARETAKHGTAETGLHLPHLQVRKGDFPLHRLPLIQGPRFNVISFAGYRKEDCANPSLN